MEEYLEEYGFHFNRRLFDFAVGMMKDRNGNRLLAWDKEKTAEFLKNYGVQLKNNVGYDAAYVANMCRADFLGSSVPDDPHLVKFIKDYLDDIDGSPTRAFDEFWIKTVAKNIPIFWDDML